MFCKEARGALQGNNPWELGDGNWPEIGEADVGHPEPEGEQVEGSVQVVHYSTFMSCKIAREIDPLQAEQLNPLQAQQRCRSESQRKMKPAMQGACQKVLLPGSGYAFNLFCLVGRPVSNPRFQIGSGPVFRLTNPDRSKAHQSLGFFKLPIISVH